MAASCTPLPHCPALISGRSVRAIAIQCRTVFIETDITDDYRTEFAKLNITDTGDMLTILNGLDYFAEIGYMAYKNNQTQQSDYD